MEVKKKKHGTLIKMVVIIAVVALVVAIVIPAFHCGCPPARKIVCLAHLKQLSLALIVYQDDEEAWPDKQSWCDVIEPYYEDPDTFQCPKDKTGPCSYAMNKNIPTEANDLPGDLVLLFESAPGWNQTGGPDDVVTDRHHKHPGANIAFADGSVQFVKAEDIANLRWAVEE